MNLEGWNRTRSCRGWPKGISSVEVTVIGEIDEAVVKVPKHNSIWIVGGAFEKDIPTFVVGVFGNVTADTLGGALIIADLAGGQGCIHCVCLVVCTSFYLTIFVVLLTAVKSI